LKSADSVPAQICTVLTDYHR